MCGGVWGTDLLSFILLVYLWRENLLHSVLTGAYQGKGNLLSARFFLLSVPMYVNVHIMPIKCFWHWMPFFDGLPIVCLIL